MTEEREFNREEELITPEQIEIILGVDMDAAEREFGYALKQLNTGSNEMLLVQFCELKGLDADEVFESLNPPGRTWAKEIDSHEELEVLPPEMEVQLKRIKYGSINNNQQPSNGDLSVFHQGFPHRFQIDSEDRSVA